MTERSGMTRTIDWVDGAIELIDQTRLPDDEVVLRITEVDTLIDAITRLAVRGAPALGVAGAMGAALARDRDELPRLRDARPTAINLARGVDRVAAVWDLGEDARINEALAVRDEEITASFAMGRRGAALVEELVPSLVARVMTICNTGALAAVERGTALAVVFELADQGRLDEVVALETRPLLQGARLTAWELRHAGIPHRVIVDGAAAGLLARGAADVVLTGADRVAANGDVANKVGTLGLALAARHAGVPFVVVAPETTLDASTPTGAEIEIEERDASEVTSWSQAFNPAFDVTPAHLITAIVTDQRVFHP